MCAEQSIRKEPYHEPVMLQEVMRFLDLKPGDFYVDGTLGLAGHARAAYVMVMPGGTVMGIDWDEAMLAEARERLPQEGVELRQGNYRLLPEFVREFGKAPNGILLDLGLNSAQLDDEERGISFQGDAPLDMRMDRSTGEPASSLINRLGENELEQILRENGGEKWSRRIAKIILEHRKEKPLRTTQDLVDCVMAAIPAAMRDKRIHPATRAFQAFRIAVNHELDDLEECFTECAQTLAPGGVMVVLSYHDGEDRPCKRAFRALASDFGFIDLTKKPLVPSQDEVERNRRSRSAKLRAIQRPKEETNE